MNEVNNVVRDALKQFTIQPTVIQPLGNAGGFSGADIYRVHTPGGSKYCLKKWPVAFDIEKLVWIHRVLIFAKANDCPELSTPVQTINGSTFISDSQGIWELTQWATGNANYLQQPTLEKLHAAIEFLARFHQATARFQFNIIPSQNVQVVIERLRAFDSIFTAACGTAKFQDGLLNKQQLNEFSGKGRALAIELASKLDPIRTQPLPVQPVIRDFRAEHLFFKGNELTAVIDFGAMRIDSVACDLSRIIGDTVGDDAADVAKLLEQYSSIRPLQAAEWQLAMLLNKASIVVGILNWLDWLFIQRRRFDDLSTVKSRITLLFDRLNNQPCGAL